MEIEPIAEKTFLWMMPDSSMNIETSIEIIATPRHEKTGITRCKIS